MLLIAGRAHALGAGEVKGMVFGDTEARVEALSKAALAADDKTVAFIQALADDAVRTQGDKVFVVKGDKAFDPVSGAELSLPADAEEVINPNLMRSELDTALAALKLLSRDESLRRDALKTLAGETDEARLPLIEKAYAAETVPALKSQLALIRAAILLGSSDKTRRLKAAALLADSHSPATKTALLDRLRVESDADVKVALRAALTRVEAALAWGDRLGAIFSGISLGSILLLVALGLAITYGLMGVINMAHGELMMIGAYATYVVQGVFQAYLPAAFDWYLLAAVPVAFGASALMGAVLERSVIRFLYGRPLETLLATWGISLMLQQLVRSIFGAQNVGVENPVWMSSGVQVLGNLSLPYNRLVIIAFAAFVLGAVAWLISRTRLGLFVRGVTQNRPIAACMGVNTARVDTYAFALGSGIAGLAGCALSQVGNVGPDLGQSYIVDAFMVVVLGGVGQLAGTVYAAMGLGILNKFLEGWTGAVLAKIAVLVFIIVFIQKRPQGIFAMKGREV
ncbi:MAG: urea ABC transporter permease subunit UrtB [Polaromonas sp. 39-63-203]|uniref:urea ABC transporter permease subunit UrtB n=1 Tax=Polaromonas sp. TaxID=1869339 RepID=UPI000BC57A1F|nr:urea ABC transporter permease subunit UrtB [Polaromonas sp.]OYY54073.1 MAG: urea ABC transporter permease subunit UrtB [Polaromonas sp. 35-63-240]OYZ03354.1 MAG: urea ABC transporter permease subunit UrtB [Polaromonas sp. 28-63-22]OYZ85191.1 MAG: urea ABC transporter permease subunit UrtB [Polaromonas sp. 24-62-144]OZB02483.1 MAG: urea ABC transporter permease subunit UrtB [Polaromonas sp. 39-63-203]HQS31919.1 urea ABC transporter permease subunit UrtB [Polaromonas sp.]